MIGCRTVRIRLEDIPEYGFEIEFPNSSLGAFSPGPAIRPKDDIVINPDVSGKLFFARDEDDILMTGLVHSVVCLPCSRCLEKHEIKLTTEIDLALKVTKADSIEDEAELEDNEIPVRGPEIELSDIIFQEILLDIPMKPLCREDCPGICPSCGSVKESEQCKCDSETQIDPRWTGLKKLRDEIGS